MLKDYKELLRMMGVINSDETVGFTTKQVEVQLDTLKRKMQTIKDDMQQGIMGLAMGTNNNGWLNDLKWFAKEINNIVVGLNGMSGGARSGITKLVWGLVGLKGLDKGIKYLTTIYQEGMLLKSMQTAEQASDVKTGAVKSWLSQRYVENAKAAAAARLAKRGYVIDSKKEQVQDAANVTQKEINTIATKEQAVSEAVNSNAVKGNTVSRIANNVVTTVSSTAKKGATVATKALTAAEVFATKTTKALTLAMARNPFGFAAVAITTLATALLFEADSAGKAANKEKEHTDAIQESISKAEEKYNQTSRQEEVATKLALKYNDLSKSLDDNALSEEERAKKTEEMGNIEKTVAEIMGRDAVQFDENGRMNIKTIHDKANANREAHLEELTQQKNSLEAKKAQLEADSTTTDAMITNAKNRILMLQDEAKAVKAEGDMWSWLYDKIGNTMVWAANKLSDIKEETGKFFFGQQSVFGSDSPMSAAPAWFNNLGDDTINSLRTKGLDMMPKNKDYDGEIAAYQKIIDEAAASPHSFSSHANEIASIDKDLSDIVTGIETIKQSADGNNPDITKRGEVTDDDDAGKSKGSRSRAEKERDLNNDILNAAKGELDLPYGGTDWRDLGEKVCTTFVQTALAQAGIDEDTVDSLTADANNWASAAGTAFHPYGTGYQTKPGDILLVNTNADGANHVAIADENANGYYAAGGNAGVSAHYNTNWESAFADEGILGVISVNEFAGVPMASKESGKVNRRSIYDFRADKYDEYQRQQELANEKYEQTKKSIDTYEKANGKDFTSALLTTQNEEDKLVSTESAAKMAQGLYNGISKRIADYISAHPEISEMLAKQGKTWDSLVPKEQSTIAELTGNSDLRKDIENREQLRKKVDDLIAARDSQRVTVDKLHGSMTPDERDAYNKANIENRYKIDVANLGNGENFAEYIGKREAETRKLTDQFDELSKELARATDDYQKFLNAGGSAESQQGMAAKKKIDELTASVKECGNELQKVSTQDMQKVKDKTADMLSDIIVEGKSFSDVWKSLWQSLAKYAINQMLSVSNQGSIWNSIFGLFGGSGASTASTSSYSIASGGGFFGLTPWANGGWLGNYADGGAIHGAGTGKSDSILAYLANKDKFAYLSNGEYVMTEEATKRIGVDNLDALNGYADGGALSPTPYVASINPATAKKATQVSGNGDTIVLLKEQNKKMSEQLSLMRGMGKDGSSQMVVLNTQASSADVLKAISDNPRAIQALMGQQRRAGFR